MRILFTCIPGLGHFNPMLPLAQALEKAGHVVAFATAPAFAETVRAAGAEHIAAGLDWDERRLVETVPELRNVSKILWGEWIMNRLFLDRSPRLMIPDLMRIVAEWRPDMIVSGSFEYGGPLVAEKLGLPYVNLSYTIRWNRWVLKFAVGRAMARLRREIGLPADPQLSAIGRHLDLCLSPPSWTYEKALLRPKLGEVIGARVWRSDLPLRQRLSGVRALLLQRLFDGAVRAGEAQAAAGNSHFIGEVRYRPEEAPPPPDWLQAMPDQPTVFVSLGTVLAAEYPGILDKILAALGDKPLNLVMTLGGTDDPARFGAQPGNVRIVRFMTQPELRALLPHVDLCINHAGYSSVMEALLRGIPLLLLPLVTDAPMNTQMCLANGVTPEMPADVWGITPMGLPFIRPDRLTPRIIADAAMEVLRNPAYREAARRMQRQLAERPGLDEAVRLIEGVMEERR